MTFTPMFDIEPEIAAAVQAAGFASCYFCEHDVDHHDNSGCSESGCNCVEPVTAANRMWVRRMYGLPLSGPINQAPHAESLVHVGDFISGQCATNAGDAYTGTVAEVIADQDGSYRYVLAEPNAVVRATSWITAG